MSAIQCQDNARAAVIVDRDGVINRAFIRNGRSLAPTRLEEFEILPDVAKNLARLKKARFQIFVATNQPDVAVGRTPRDVVEAMHDVLLTSLPVDGIYTCFHGEEDGCGCRKPKPGLLLAAAQDYGVSLSRSYMVGDRWRDIGAGEAAGCRTILIDQGFAERHRCTPDFVVETLSDAVAIIVLEQNRGWAQTEA